MTGDRGHHGSGLRGAMFETSAFVVVSGELTEEVVTPGGLRAQCCKERAFGPRPRAPDRQ
ncbi:hypothetical protein [Allorhizocola rhizosphaerae]|uniref:hypothetical protein n=1 Tax=Allorhizocola rhizosphaerae TaxID=1872709 RepID=UPI000E3EDB8E|nr:hypothetical protein [Allorhizocola rhizosphaerae]